MANELITLRAQLEPSITMDLSSAVAISSLVEEVETDGEARNADIAIRRLKAAIKAVHDQRMTVTRKVDAFKKALITEEEDICAAANAELTRIQGLCTAFLTEKEEIEAAERAKEAERVAKENEDAVEEALITGGVAEVQVIAEAPKKPIVSGVRAREYWTFDIVDDASVPRQYCSADRRLIQQYMDDARKAGTSIEALNISGVSFRKEIRV